MDHAGVEKTDRGGAFEHVPGSGGPTGCREAYLTVMGDDGFLAGVLILLHTVRKYAYIDRDFVVIVSTAVTQPIIERLQEECVRVIQVHFGLPFTEQQVVVQSYYAGNFLTVLDHAPFAS